jgi:hypothetical protein
VPVDLAEIAERLRSSPRDKKKSSAGLVNSDANADIELRTAVPPRAGDACGAKSIKTRRWTRKTRIITLI